MSTSIQDQLAAAVGARKDSLKALRGRIIDLVRHAPVGVKLTDDQGVIVEVVRLFTGASQCDNRTWDVTIKGWGVDRGSEPGVELGLDITFTSGKETLLQGENGCMPSIDGVVAITGRPHAAASLGGSPQPSPRLGNT